MRFIWQPQAQVVLSGSWWISVRGSSGGSGLRLAWPLPADGLPESCSSSSVIAARSASTVSSNSWACSAGRRSVLTPKRQRLCSDSSWVSWSILVWRQVSSRSWR
jgi:hypothetical protein